MVQAGIGNTHGAFIKITAHSTKLVLTIFTVAPAYTS